MEEWTYVLNLQRFPARLFFPREWEEQKKKSIVPTWFDTAGACTESVGVLGSCDGVWSCFKEMVPFLTAPLSANTSLLVNHSTFQQAGVVSWARQSNRLPGQGLPVETWLKSKSGYIYGNNKRKVRSWILEERMWSKSRRGNVKEFNSKNLILTFNS